MSDTDILQMALVGFQAELQKIELAMAAIRSQMGVHSNAASAAVVPTGKAKTKRTMSAKGKAAIRLALKKRWAAFHAKADAGKPAKKTVAKKAVAKKAAVKKAAPKKKLSAARKAALVANLAKARAAKAAKKTEGEAVPF